MATDNPYGFKLMRSFANAPIHLYNIASDYATALYKGDPVKLAGSADTDGIPTIALAAAGDTPCGVIVGFVHTNKSNLDRLYSPATTSGYALVCDDPNAIFKIQCESEHAITAADVGLNVNWVATHSGSTTTGLSGAEADASAAATTNTLDLNIRRVVQRPDNAIGDYTEIEVTFNNHQFGRGSNGTGQLGL